VVNILRLFVVLPDIAIKRPVFRERNDLTGRWSRSLYNHALKRAGRHSTGGELSSAGQDQPDEDTDHYVSSDPIWVDLKPSSDGVEGVFGPMRRLI
jgi:hypothetical protein